MNDTGTPSLPARDEGAIKRALDLIKEAGRSARAQLLFQLSAGLSEARAVLEQDAVPDGAFAARLAYLSFSGVLPDPPPGGDVLVPVTFGSERDRDWKPAEVVSWAELCEALTDHKAGAKEGTCIVPAVFRGRQRRKSDAAEIHVLMLDSDCGHFLDEIRGKLAGKGWAAIIASTHSHMTEETRCLRKHLEGFQSQHPGSALSDYLERTKGYVPAVARGAEVMRGDGDHIVLRHRPCPKFRIALRLEQPWRASDYADQAEANTAWRHIVVGVAAELGLNIDQACTDPSRLFYLPRHPESATPVSRVLPGSACPRPAGPAAAAVSPAVSQSQSPAVFDDGSGNPFNLTTWAAEHGRRFKVVEALQARSSGAFRGHVNDGRHHIVCPFHEDHTNPDPDGATFVANPGQAEASGFVICCRHAHCADRDRLAFVKRMLEDGTLTRDDLVAERFLLPASDPLEAAVLALNKRCAVARVGGRTVIISESEDDGRHTVNLGPVADARTWFATEHVNINGNSKPLFSLWLSHGSRRAYRSIGFTPGQTRPGEYNLWHGFAVKPDRTQSCKLFLTHLRENVCQGDDVRYRWLLAFFAQMIQRPMEKPGVALALRGGQGTGKTIVGEIIGQLFPEHRVILSQPGQLTGNFNSHLRRALLIQVEEAFWAGDKKALGALKHLITSETLMIEPKGVDAFPVRNCSRLLLTSNEHWVVPADRDQRRFAVFDVGDARKQDRTYFQAIVVEAAAGGLAGLLDVLNTFDLRTVDLHDIPRTEALREQKLASLGSIAAWWYARLHDGHFLYSEREWPSEIATNALYSDYARFTKERHGRVEGDALFGAELNRWAPKTPQRRPRDGGPRQRVRTLPALSTCREHFAGILGHDIAWDG